MKKIVFVLTLVIVFVGCSSVLAADASSDKTSIEKLDAALKRFVKLKRAQVNDFAREQEKQVPDDVVKMFDALEAGRIDEATNIFSKLELRSGRMGGARDSFLGGMMWQPIAEAAASCEQAREWEKDLCYQFCVEITNAVPAGSIYFGGSDTGRFVVSSFCESQIQGKPFFVLTQNPLADGSYMEYIRKMYAGQIHIPTEKDCEQAFRTYLEDAQERKKQGRLKKGENVRVVNGRVQANGQAAVMGINGLIAKKIFELNPDRDFFIEETFTLDWMDPYLTPAGLIFKLNRNPVRVQDVLKKDHDYWRAQTKALIGDWVTYDTKTREVCAFVEKVYGERNLTGFKGNPRHVRSQESERMFAKVRTSIAGLYARRADAAQTEADSVRLEQEAEFAYKQAFALGPLSQDAMEAYAGFLKKIGRANEAVLVANTSARLNPKMEGIGSFIEELKRK